VKGPNPSYRQRPLVPRPDVSMVSVEPEGRYDCPTSNAGANRCGVSCWTILRDTRPLRSSRAPSDAPDRPTVTFNRVSEATHSAIRQASRRLAIEVHRRANARLRPCYVGILQSAERAIGYDGNYKYRGGVAYQPSPSRRTNGVTRRQNPNLM
jgi:hypothetical protein